MTAVLNETILLALSMVEQVAARVYDPWARLQCVNEIIEEENIISERPGRLVKITAKVAMDLGVQGYTYQCQLVRGDLLWEPYTVEVGGKHFRFYKSLPKPRYYLRRDDEDWPPNV